jgi:hypothetical protein
MVSERQLKITALWTTGVGIATGYGLNDLEVRVRIPVEARIFSFSYHPYRFWDPPSLLSNGYRVLFP